MMLSQAEHLELIEVRERQRARAESAGDVARARRIAADIEHARRVADREVGSQDA